MHGRLLLGRERCVELVVEQLGATPVGREHGLHRVTGIEDLRAAVPIRDALEHEQHIESRLGFGLIDGHDHAVDLTCAEAERDQVSSIWRAYLPEFERPRIAWLHGRSVDPVIDSIHEDDLRAWGGEVLRIERLDNPEAVLRELEGFDPEVLVMPSLYGCQALESVHRAPLEYRLHRLKTILCEYDSGRTIRSALPVRSSGWIGRGGRFGLPSMRMPADCVTLAVGTLFLELLPHSNPEEDARRVFAEHTILPEQAIVGRLYEVVVTSAIGLLRMRTDQHVRVIGFDAPSEHSPFPRPRVLRLPSAPLDVRLEGCTVAGAWLAASIRQAFLREDPALVAAEIAPDPLSIPAGVGAMRTGSMRLPSSFKDTELAWLSRTADRRVVRRRPAGLLVRVEVQGFAAPDLAHKLAERIDRNLSHRSPAYAYLRDRDELLPPRVIVLSAGTRRAEEERRTAELLGEVWVPEVRVLG